MLFRIAGLIRDSVVDGPGLRLALFTQGCPHACPGCHNPNTHDFSGGQEADTADIIQELANNPLWAGITLTGGEPFCQPEAMLEIAKAAREMGKSVWAYSGWTFEELLLDEKKRALLEACDVLVDGRFILERRSLALRFRGSDNQRVIDVPASLKEGKVVLWQDPWDALLP
ncbi:MAG: anaerobic ribonucleoside-triphosphate reductase activating protein [Christensenellales bacterium]